jgi:hypothetical protein
MEHYYTLDEVRLLADRRPPAREKPPLPRRPGRRGARRTK